jgi:hypothetical protein
MPSIGVGEHAKPGEAISRVIRSEGELQKWDSAFSSFRPPRETYRHFSLMLIDTSVEHNRPGLSDTCSLIYTSPAIIIARAVSIVGAIFLRINI